MPDKSAAPSGPGGHRLVTPPAATTRLLVSASRRTHSGPDRERLREALAGGADWARLLESARREAVGPLLYKSLAGFGTAVPGDVLAELRRLYLGVLQRNVGLFARLGPLLDRIRTAGLRVAVTKGARLAESLYGDVALRPFVDVDLVVHPGDWPPFERLLGDLDYRTVPAAAAAPDPTAGRLRWLFSPVYSRDGIRLEMHFGALGLYSPLVDEAGFWESMERQAIGGVEATVLSPEHELAYVCLHALQHSFERLIWLVDIAELCAAGRVRWERLAALCEREKIAVPVRHGLALVEGLWPGTVPAAVLAGPAGSGPAARLCRLLWPADRIRNREAVPVLPYYASTIFVLWGRKNPWLALRALGAILFPPPAWVAYSYGIPRGSIRMAHHYLWRLFWPAGVLARRFLGERP